MSDFWLGFTYGAGITIAVIVALYGVLNAWLDSRERRATDWSRVRQEAAETPVPRHSARLAADPTRRLYPPEITDSGVNLLADQDGGRATRLPSAEEIIRNIERKRVAGHDDRPLDAAPPPWPYQAPRPRDLGEADGGR